MTSDFNFDSIISLGVDCRVRFQASRFFDKTRSLPPSNAAALESSELTSSVVEKHLFDWNIVWFSDVIKMIDQDFVNIFAQDRLVPAPTNREIAMDGIYGIRYYHLFKVRPSQLLSDAIREQYESVAPKVFYQRDKLRSHLRSKRRTLYVRCDGSTDEAERFSQLINARYPDHPFHLLLIQPEDQTGGFILHTPDYSVYQMNRRVEKPEASAWSGDDQEWDRLLEESRSILRPKMTANLQSITFSIDQMRRSTSIGLIGACVSRDMREALFPGTKANYIWRVGTLSLMSAAPSHLPIHVPDADRAAQLTLDRDVNKCPSTIMLSPGNRL